MEQTKIILQDARNAIGGNINKDISRSKNKTVSDSLTEFVDLLPESQNIHGGTTTKRIRSIESNLELIDEYDLKIIQSYSTALISIVLITFLSIPETFNFFTKWKVSKSSLFNDGDYE